jgi:hypothetical protein
VGSIGWRSKMIRAGYRDDVDDCQTPLMGVSGQARSLQPSELAHASVMGALCAAIAIIAVVLPHAGGLGLLGAVPMGLLAYRYRIRALDPAARLIEDGFDLWVAIVKSVGLYFPRYAVPGQL